MAEVLGNIDSNKAAEINDRTARVYQAKEGNSQYNNIWENRDNGKGIVSYTRIMQVIWESKMYHI